MDKLCLVATAPFPMVLVVNWAITVKLSNADPSFVDNGQNAFTGSEEMVKRTLAEMLVLCPDVQMSSCTYDCLDVYKDSVDSTCDAVDSGIKVMR